MLTRWSARRAQLPTEDVRPCISEGPTKLNFISDARNGSAHLEMVWVVADAIVHGINCMHHQTDCHLVLAVHTIQEESLNGDSWRITFLQSGGKQIMYKWTSQNMFNAILRVFPLAEEANTPNSALIPRLCVPAIKM